MQAAASVGGIVASSKCWRHCSIRQPASKGVTKVIIIIKRPEKPAGTLRHAVRAACLPKQQVRQQPSAGGSRGEEEEKEEEDGGSGASILCS